MARERRPWALLGLAVLPVAAGFLLGRQAATGEPSRQDMLDAVVAVQRRSPLFLISGPYPGPRWPDSGHLYLCRSPQTVEDTERLVKYPRGCSLGRPWVGVVCIRGTADRDVVEHPWLTDGGDRCVRYGAFAVYGDPDLLRDVRAALDDAGFRPLD